MDTNLPIKIVLELKFPVPVKELAAITDALVRLHGPSLQMRQTGPYLQIFKPDLSKKLNPEP